MKKFGRTEKDPEFESWCTQYMKSKDVYESSELFGSIVQWVCVNVRICIAAHAAGPEEKEEMCQSIRNKIYFSLVQRKNERPAEFVDNWGGYLCRTAVNVVRDYVRSKARQNAHYGDLFEELKSNEVTRVRHESRVSKHNEDEERYEKIWNAIASLKISRLNDVLFFYIQGTERTGLTPAQIGKIVGLSERSVEHILQQMKTRLLEKGVIRTDFVNRLRKGCKKKWKKILC